MPSIVQFGSGPLSLLDPTQAPPGKHTTYAWHVMPFDPDIGGRSTETFCQEFAEQMLETWARYSPNMTKANIIGKPRLHGEGVHRRDDQHARRRHLHGRVQREPSDVQSLRLSNTDCRTSTCPARRAIPAGRSRAERDTSPPASSRATSGSSRGGRRGMRTRRWKRSRGGRRRKKAPPSRPKPATRTCRWPRTVGRAETGCFAGRSPTRRQGRSGFAQRALGADLRTHATECSARRGEERSSANPACRRSCRSSGRRASTRLAVRLDELRKLGRVHIGGRAAGIDERLHRGLVGHDRAHGVAESFLTIGAGVPACTNSPAQM